MRRAGPILALLALAALALAPVHSGAGKVKRVKAKTEVQIMTVFKANNNEGTEVIGRVGSPKRKCLASRHVSITFFGQGELLYDVARSSRKGAWLGRNDPDALAGVVPISRVEAEVARRKIRLSPRKVLICRAATHVSEAGD